jgi:hypothetical protein
MFVPRNENTWYYAANNLFLYFNGLFCPISHKQVLTSFAGARRFTVGLFLFSLLIANKLRDVVFIPIKLIKSAHDQDWLRSLAYFIRLKSLYVNNTHYNFNLRGLSQKLGCSPACLYIHLRELRNRGLVVDHSGNLCFRGLRKLSVIAEGGKNIGVPVDHKNQLDCLRAQLIRFNLSQQEYNIRKFGVQKCPRRDTPFNFSERTSSCYVGLSAEGFGKVLGLSLAQGAAIRSKLIQIGLLSFHRRFSVLFASGGPCGGLWLKKMKRQGLVPYYAKIREDKVIVERRMELKYERA